MEFYEAQIEMNKLYKNEIEKLLIYDRLKIPEGIRIPFVTGYIYNYFSNRINNLMSKVDSKYFVLNQEERAERIIVSLTTYPQRINQAIVAIKSLFLQTILPDQIHLYLSAEQFEKIELPKELVSLKSKGLYIHFVDDDLKSHKKYYYIFQNQKKDDLVITYDDDIIYPPDSIERLIKKHQVYRNAIICNRAESFQMIDNRISDYCDWKVLSKRGIETPSIWLVPSTGGGTLYPFNSVNKECFNKDNIKTLALTADDIWMRFMSLKNETLVLKTRKYHRTFTTVSDSQISHLGNINCIQNGNNIVIQNLSKQYRGIIDWLNKENNNGES